METVYAVKYSDFKYLKDGFNYIKNKDSFSMVDTGGLYVDKGIKGLLYPCPYIIMTNRNKDKILITYKDKNNLSIGNYSFIKKECGYSNILLKSSCFIFDKITFKPLSKLIFHGCVKDVIENIDKIFFIYHFELCNMNIKSKTGEKMEWLTYKDIYKNYGKFDNISKIIINEICSHEDFLIKN